MLFKYKISFIELSPDGSLIITKRACLGQFKFEINRKSVIVILIQGSQTRIYRRATFQRKMLRGPQFDGKRAYAGHKLLESSLNKFNFD